MSLLNLLLHNQGKGRPIGGTKSYQQKVLALAPIAYWKFADGVGTTNPIDSSGNGYTATNSNFVFGSLGIGDGSTSAYNASTLTAYVDTYSAGWAAAFPGAAGSFFIWAKIKSATELTDGTQHHICRIRADVNNVLEISKTATNNNLNYKLTAGGAVVQVTKADYSDVSWVTMAITWTDAGDQFIAYYNGTQVGTIQTGVGTWSGALSDASSCLLQGNKGSLTAWLGYAAHCAIFNHVLSPAQILGLSLI